MFVSFYQFFDSFFGSVVTYIIVKQFLKSILSATNLKKGRDRELKFSAIIDIAFSCDHKTVRCPFRVLLMYLDQENFSRYLTFLFSNILL